MSHHEDYRRTVLHFQESIYPGLIHSSLCETFVGRVVHLEQVKGDRFVHGGRKGMPLPEYIDPYTLLEEDRDRPDMRRVPFR